MAIQGGGCVVTVVAMAMALWIATAFGLAMTAKKAVMGNPAWRLRGRPRIPLRCIRATHLLR